MAGSMNEAGSCLNRRKIDILSRRYPELLILRDNMTTRFHFDKKFETRWNNKANWGSVAATYGLNQQLITWYTDVSFTAEGAGAGVIGPRKMYFEPMGRYSSIFQAEIYAIDKCASFNLQRNYRRQNIAILTESQAAIKALRSNQVNSKLVWECLERLNILGSSNNVWILWVPGHAGLEGNEAADELAKKGAETPLHGPEPFCGIGNGLMAMNLRNEEKRLRELYWAGLPGMEHTHKGLLKPHQNEPPNHSGNSHWSLSAELPPRETMDIYGHCLQVLCGRGRNLYTRPGTVSGTCAK
ncbi:unnamed protein product [Hermetia illucens]|uniref:ribonuclease H n=1 Tax=Hermetia illucens TaxID=343691 RepID=A0A7R8UMP1_HERIL|nr:unnamed protein product [Hermetia illucens]